MDQVIDKCVELREILRKRLRIEESPLVAARIELLDAIITQVSGGNALDKMIEAQKRVFERTVSGQ